MHKKFKLYGGILAGSLAIILLALFFSSWGSGSSESAQANTQRVKVAQVVEEAYLQPYQTNGEISAKNSVSVTTRHSGTVAEIKVKEGDFIEADAELFTYQTGGAENEADIALQTAEDNYNTASSAAASARQNAAQAASMSLKQLQSTREETLLAVQHAEESLTVTQKSYEDAVSASAQNISLAEQGVILAEVAYNTAQNNFDTVQASSSLSSEQVLESALTVPADTWPSVNTAIVLADEILGVSAYRRYDNDSFEDNLKAMNNSRFTEAQQTLRQLFANDDQYDWEQNPEVTPEFLADYQDFINDVERLLILLDNILAEGITGSSFTSTERDSLRSSISLAQQNTTLARQSVQSAIHTLQSTDLSTDSQVIAATDALASAKESIQQSKITLEQTRSTSRQAVATAELSLLSAKNALESAQTSRENQVEQAELAYQNALTSQQLVNAQQDAAVLSAQNALANVKNNYFEQLERAPISGYVSNITIEEGESVNNNQVFLTIVKTDQRTAEFRIPTEIAPLISTDTVGTVTCSQGSVSAQVSEIGITAGSGHTVEAEVELSEDATDLCRVGELVRINLEIEREAQTIIPVGAFTWRASLPVVWVIEDEKLVARRVEVEQVLDDCIIISSGLSAGEQVVTNPSGTFRDGDSTEIIE